MSEPIEEKNNEHIRRDKAAFTHAYMRARKELGRLEGVAGVGFGLKEVNGTFTDDVAIEVFVREKKRDSELSDEQRVPKRFEGYRTDVRVVPRGEYSTDTGSEDMGSYPTIKGGIGIEAWPRRASDAPAVGDRQTGTLGCIVKKRGDTATENVHLLTCLHLFKSNKAEDGDFIYQPNGPLFLGGGVGDGRVVATIDRAGWDEYGPRDVEFEAALNPATGQPYPDPIGCYVDAGIAKIDVQSKCCNTPCGSGGTAYDTTIVGLKDLGLTSDSIADVRNLLIDVDIVSSAGDKHVYKRGKATRGTTGVVTSVNATWDLYAANGTLIKEVYNLIEIAFEPTAAQPKNNNGNLAFSDHGDSGSIVLDAQNRAVGMIVGHEKHADKTSPEQVLTYKVYACHIVAVLDALNICIVTSGGTSYGSCAATDGSGLVGSADRTADSQGERTAAAERRSRRAADPQPNVTPLNDAERDRFIAVRAALRETARGRRIDDTFAEIQREIGLLVRTCRPVTVAWHRHRGPAFLAYAINHLRGNADSIPGDIGGITREMLLTRMRDVLLAHGSDALKCAIERHEADLMLLASSPTVDACIEILRQVESTETPA